jgi:hypothetical protein
VSGGGGHIILAQHAVAALSDPIIHGQLPTNMALAVDAVLAKDPGTWTTVDNKTIGKAFEWGLLHCT